jgi:uncharacterized membrane protein YeaQ/YmgE (transglycosylase-associated protein family)
MIVNLILWIVFGALVGWLASIITHTNDQQGPIGNIIVGIIGAMFGGFLSSALGGPAVTGFNIASIAVATVGAVILLFFSVILRRGATRS